MSDWNVRELERIARADELEIASRRADGSLRPFVTIWSARAGDDLYVRSAHGSDNPWFRRARRAKDGRVRVGGVERDVLFDHVGSEGAPTIDAAYQRKYDRHGAKMVGTVVSPDAHSATLRVVPR